MYKKKMKCKKENNMYNLGSKKSAAETVTLICDMNY